jgi:hypothetical protein
MLRLPSPDQLQSPLRIGRCPTRLTMATTSSENAGGRATVETGSIVSRRSRPPTLRRERSNSWATDDPQRGRGTESTTSSPHSSQR